MKELESDEHNQNFEKSVRSLVLFVLFFLLFHPHFRNCGSPLPKPRRWYYLAPGDVCVSIVVCFLFFCFFCVQSHEPNLLFNLRVLCVKLRHQIGYSFSPRDGALKKRETFLFSRVCNYKKVSWLSLLDFDSFQLLLMCPANYYNHYNMCMCVIPGALRCNQRCPFVALTNFFFSSCDFEFDFCLVLWMSYIFTQFRFIFFYFFVLFVSFG